MKQFFTALIALVLFGIAPALAQQIVTSTPSPLQESSQGIVLTYNAASPLGNNGLKNLTTASDVYAHIGVITSRSTDNADWKYVVTPWPESGNDQAANTAKNRLTKTADNTYTLNIGDIRTYFGITDRSEHVQKIALVFRNADGSKQGKTKSGGDIFVDVLFDGFALELSSDHPDNIIGAPTTINFTVQATSAANLELLVNDKVFASKQNTTSLTAPYEFKETGYYTVKARSVYDNYTYEESMEISYPAGGAAATYPGGVPKMGAVKNADGSVTFCLAAPGKVSCQLVGSWNDYELSADYLMKYQDYQGNRYFWTTVNGLANDRYYSYFYVVDDKYKVADPYAHLVLDCYSDRYERNSVWPTRPKYPYDKFSDVMMAVYRGDLDDYKFSPFTIPAHDNLVIYELLLRDFTGIDGMSQGWGTLKKAIDKIPYIKAMGFNAIELMPIMEFNGTNSWGYNTNFYMAPDKAYGSPTDYKDFIEACHKEGIAVILDIVFNQSDGLHPWYQMYPIESNPFYNKNAPHAYSVLNDWNQDNPLVQQQWTDALKYWMEKYNVDGFRFDLVKGLGDNGSYGSGTEAYNQSRVDRMKRLHAVIKSVKPNGIHINENLASAREETAMGEDGQINWANINDASCQFTMGWDNGNNNLFRFLSSRDSRPWGSTVSYAESHDEQRMGYKSMAYGVTGVKDGGDAYYDRLGQLAVQMLLTPGPKMVWQFGELGNDQSTKDANGGNDTSPKLVDWRWLDDPDRHYLMETYGAVINLRMRNPELFAQTATFAPDQLSSKFDKPRTMRLTAGDKEVIAFINPASTGAAVTVSCSASSISASNKQLIRASKGFEPVLTGTGTVSVSVPANGFAIFASKRVAGVESVPVVGIDTDKATVYGARGRIVIDGDYTTASVYTLDGRQCAGLEVAAGLYIVVVDGKATKVLVR